MTFTNLTRRVLPNQQRQLGSQIPYHLDERGAGLGVPRTFTADDRRRNDARKERWRAAAPFATASSERANQSINELERQFSQVSLEKEQLLANWNRLEPQAKRKSEARRQMLVIERQIAELDIQANALKSSLRAMKK